MMERDQELQDGELQKVLRQWKAPEASRKLDERTLASYRQWRSGQRRKWMALAAGVLLAVGGVSLWLGRRVTVVQPQGEVKLETRVDAAGFRAVGNGTITVVRAGEKQ